MATTSRSPFKGDADQYLDDDDSFSTYLAHVRQSFSNASSRRSSLQNPTTTAASTSEGVRPELDVFRAEKYFSGVLDHQISSSKSYNGSSRRASGCSVEGASSCTGVLGVKFVSSSSGCAGRQRGFFSVFRCYCAPKSAVVEEEEEDGGDVRCRIYAKTPASDFRRSLEVGRGERWGPLNREGSSELFEISGVHSMK